ncbi:MAG: hypothetical protein H7X93_10505, partial [Sphingomonadaceae bacterium]|nr:hypothetical protein [Sphingomonadaceae bacterium]
MIRAALLIALASLALASCGLRPLYGGASSPAREVIGEVEVGPIEGRAG